MFTLLHWGQGDGWAGKIHVRLTTQAHSLNSHLKKKKKGQETDCYDTVAQIYNIFPRAVELGHTILFIKHT